MNKNHSVGPGISANRLVMLESCGLYRWGRQEWSLSKGRRWGDMETWAGRHWRSRGRWEWRRVGWTVASQNLARKHEQITHWHRKSTPETGLAINCAARAETAMWQWMGGESSLLCCRWWKQVCATEQVEVVRVELGTAAPPTHPNTERQISG